MEAIVHKRLATSSAVIPVVFATGLKSRMHSWAAARPTGVEHRKMWVELVGQIVSVEDCHLSCSAQTSSSHEANVCVRDREDARGAPWRRSDWTDPRFRSRPGDEGMVGEEWCEVGADADGADSRPTATVRDR